MFLVKSAYFNLRNNLPNSGTFPPGHPVYTCANNLNSYFPSVALVSWKLMTAHRKREELKIKMQCDNLSTLYSGNRNVTLKMAGLPAETCRWKYHNKNIPVESCEFCWFLTYVLKINARKLERITRIDKNTSPDIRLVMKKKQTKDVNI